MRKVSELRLELHLPAARGLLHNDLQMDIRQGFTRLPYSTHLKTHNHIRLHGACAKVASQTWNNHPILSPSNSNWLCRMVMPCSSYFSMHVRLTSNCHTLSLSLLGIIILSLVTFVCLAEPTARLQSVSMSWQCILDHLPPSRYPLDHG